MNSKYSKFLVLVLAFITQGCSCPAPLHTLPKTEEKMQWFPPAADARGVVLVTPGLNNKPASMLPLIEELNTAGFAAALFTFAGHEADAALKHSATAQKWQEELSSFYCKVKERYPGKKIFVLGYSMGAAITTAFLDAVPASNPCLLQQESELSAIFFLAPAITPRASAYPLRLLSNLHALNLSIPSLAPVESRRHSSTSLASYRALFDTVDAVALLKHPEKLNRIPAKIVIREDDELVSPARLKGWLEKNKLSSWQMTELKGSAQSGHYAHMLIEQKSFSESEWRELRREISGFFEEHC